MPHSVKTKLAVVFGADLTLNTLYFSESSVDISISEDRTNNSVQHPLRTPFTSDLGMVSNRSSFVSQVSYENDLILDKISPVCSVLE